MPNNPEYQTELENTIKLIRDNAAQGWFPTLIIVANPATGDGQVYMSPECSAELAAMVKKWFEAVGHTVLQVQ